MNILELFNEGFDTVDIATLVNLPEHEVERILHDLRDVALGEAGADGDPSSEITSAREVRS